MVSKEEKTETGAGSDVERLQKLYDVMVKEGLDSLELKDKDSRIRLNRRSTAPPAWTNHPGQGGYPTPPPMPAAAAAPTEPAEPVLDPANSIQTPLAGLFYRAASPTAAPFVREGDMVEAGQTLCIVEAMKVMNEIKAANRCRIVKILIENGRPVNAGQALFKVEPAA